ncbi:sensor histidine kinase [Sutcliffiella halmapala]|uniref:sensor histidine kinase n=1 Tax=Sutcliffiella halmapala TaxID=79882 RepID=UPI000995451C|nr:sensor histidine kinase [Sutcliffiella halmapala]
MKDHSNEIWNPKTSTLLWRVLGLLLLSLFWLTSQSSEFGVILLLFLAVMALARWRFSLPGWTVLIDQAACLMMLFSWEDAWLALSLPIFEAFRSGKKRYLIPSLIALLFYAELSIALISLSVLAAFSGLVIRSWEQQMEQYRLEVDRERRTRYELEVLKRELLLANAKAARTAELTERNRISQELHDHVGHELTGATLALQAFEQLWEENDPQAKDFFGQLKERLFKSTQDLRETVHNMKPVKPLGIDVLEEVCRAFTAYPIDFKVYGNTEKIPVYLWSILEPCLKETLTNVSRHANATKVEVSLDVSESIVRLAVYNDGETSGTLTSGGVGLRNLRQRAKSVGGSVAFHTKDGFQFVCVLPIEDAR